MTIAAGRRFLHRPRKSAENITAGAALMAALVLLAFGFGAPLQRTVATTGFRQAGTFSYNAKTLKAQSAYPGGIGRTGQPLFLDFFDKITVGFSYRFSSELAHHVHGTVSLKALIASDSSWRNLYTLQKPTAFSGDVTRIGGTFSLKQLQLLLNQISVDSGTPGAEYTIDLQPVVHVTGTVNGKPIKSTFSPVLPFTATSSLLKLDIAQAATPPGATFATPSAAATLAAGLNPHMTGTIPGIAPNDLLVARYHITVSALRGAGLGLLGLAFLAFASKLFSRPREVWSNEKRVAARYGCVVVDVVSFTDATPATHPATEVPDFEALATLAQYCERPILRESRGQVVAYAVEDDGRLYVHRPGTVAAVSRLAAAGTS